MGMMQLYFTDVAGMRSTWILRFGFSSVLGAGLSVIMQACSLLMESGRSMWSAHTIVLGLIGMGTASANSMWMGLAERTGAGAVGMEVESVGTHIAGIYVWGATSLFDGVTVGLGSMWLSCNSIVGWKRTLGNTPKYKILWRTKMFKIDPLCRILLQTGMVIWAQRLDTRFVQMCPVNSHVGYPWRTILEPEQTSLPYYPEMPPMSLCLESHDKFST